MLSLYAAPFPSTLWTQKGFVALHFPPELFVASSATLPRAGRMVPVYSAALPVVFRLFVWLRRFRDNKMLSVNVFTKFENVFDEFAVLVEWGARA